nr:glycine cleavage system aminomethyltransferase GcvT [Rhodospirillales bacterium]
MSDLKQIPLYDLHRSLNAKMVTYAGYQMPVQYPTGIIKEHLHCRSQVGFFDISHMGQCLLRGLNIMEKLDLLIPSALNNLAKGHQCYSVLTNASGGIIDDLMISRLDNDLMIVVNGNCKEKDFAYLKSRLNVQVLSDQALFALQGPMAKIVMAQLSDQACQLYYMQTVKTKVKGIKCIISRSGYTGEDGFEISVANHYAREMAELLLSFQQVKPMGLGARDTLRLESGFCLYGNELTDTITPVEASLHWLIDKDKRNFPGEKIIREQLQRGAVSKRIGLIVEGRIPVREHQSIHDSDHRIVGMISSGRFSPSLNKPIAMALIDGQCSDATLYAYVRNKTIAMQVTPLPFVNPRYHRRN